MQLALNQFSTTSSQSMRTHAQVKLSTIFGLLFLGYVIYLLFTRKHTFFFFFLVLFSF